MSRMNASHRLSRAAIFVASLVLVAPFAFPEVARAGVEDLSRVPGISRALAQQIYDAFHGDN